ncbi:variable surface protein [Plasmodium gonderi]|uniref:Variable surface protein n=1 Tax=Plasmodium gonderi TaxID=77519 RepID=A0A1Y1JE83_PLAGO|nr:variable surface protein [Plasmodium gonderi]GAW80806.1 variable surface protein [Plasmodium gonderi]
MSKRHNPMIRYKKLKCPNMAATTIVSFEDVANVTSHNCKHIYDHILHEIDDKLYLHELEEISNQSTLCNELKIYLNEKENTLKSCYEKKLLSKPLCEEQEIKKYQVKCNKFLGFPINCAFLVKESVHIEDSSEEKHDYEKLVIASSDKEGEPISEIDAEFTEEGDVERQTSPNLNQGSADVERTRLENTVTDAVHSELPPDKSHGNAIETSEQVSDEPVQATSLLETCPQHALEGDQSINCELGIDSCTHHPHISSTEDCDPSGVSGGHHLCQKIPHTNLQCDNPVHDTKHDEKSVKEKSFCEQTSDSEIPSNVTPHVRTCYDVDSVQRDTEQIGPSGAVHNPGHSGDEGSNFEKPEHKVTEGETRDHKPLPKENNGTGLFPNSESVDTGYFIQNFSLVHIVYIISKTNLNNQRSYSTCVYKNPHVSLSEQPTGNVANVENPAPNETCKGIVGCQPNISQEQENSSFSDSTSGKSEESEQVSDSLSSIDSTQLQQSSTTQMHTENHNINEINSGNNGDSTKIVVSVTANPNNTPETSNEKGNEIPLKIYILTCVVICAIILLLILLIKFTPLGMISNKKSKKKREKTKEKLQKILLQNPDSDENRISFAYSRF